MKKFILMLLLLLTLNGCTNEPDTRLSCNCIKSGKNQFEAYACPNEKPLSIIVNVPKRLFRVLGKSLTDFEYDDLSYGKLKIDDTYILHEAWRMGWAYNRNELNRITLMFEHTFKNGREVIGYELFQCQITNGVQ